MNTKHGKGEKQWNILRLWVHVPEQNQYVTNLYVLPKSWNFTITSHHRGIRLLVQHNTNFSTVHSQVTIGGCSVEYDYKLVILEEIVGQSILFATQSKEKFLFCVEELL